MYDITFPDGSIKKVHAHTKREALEQLRIEKKAIVFVPQTLSLITDPSSVSGFVAEQTGLGYYQNSQGWILIHLQSGTTLGKYTVQTQGQAQIWLELLLLLRDWNKSVSELRNTANESMLLQVEIAQARAKALGSIPL